MQQEYRAHTQVSEDGSIVLENLPFAAGEAVQVIVTTEAGTETSGEPVNGVDSSGRASDAQVDAMAILESLAGSVEAPPDWADEHDHYLYGTPKRSDRQG